MSREKTIDWIAVGLSILIAVVTATYGFAQTSAKTDMVEDKVEAFADHYSSKQTEFVTMQKDVEVLKEQSIAAKEDRQEIKQDLREVLTILRDK